MIPAYRTCFNTEAGKSVLAHMLANGGYFDDDVSTPEDVAIVNFLKRILKNIGVCNIETVDSYVQNLFNLPTNFGEQDGKEES